MYKACIIVLSDREYTGEEKDSEGRRLEKFLGKDKFEVVVYKIIPEVEDIYKEFLMKCCDDYCVDLVVTIGNRSLAEMAVNEVIEEEIISSKSYRRKNTLIKNLEDTIWESEIEVENLIDVIKKNIINR